MPYKVLVVDDEPSVRDLFKDLLIKEKYSVQCASSGEEALGIIRREDFDIVLLDIKLSSMSGFETLKKIKQVKPSLIVIMTTGFGYDEVLIAKSKDLGCSGYIGKNIPTYEIMKNFRLFAQIAKETKG